MIRTRFAPSPTGFLHIGGVRTALFNWLFARHHGGRFVLRIDDTDQERNVAEALRPILDGFRWLGIDWDEGEEVGGEYGPYRQSERLDRYRSAVGRLLESGAAYRDYARPEEIGAERDAARAEKRHFIYSRAWMAETEEECAQYEAQERSNVVRLKMPRDGVCELNDLVRGELAFSWAQEMDHVIQRSDGTCLYHLANVVDDHDMKISHVIRAEEHLSNTPRQIFIARSLGYELPEYAHLPYVAEPGSKNKLSKRKLVKYLKNRDFSTLNGHGARVAARIGLKTSDDTFNPVLVEFYERIGFLPDAIINYLLLLGWSLDDRTEYLGRDDMVTLFSLERVNKAPASFDPMKLMAFQERYMKELSAEAMAKLVLPYVRSAGLASDLGDDALLSFLARIVEAAGDRIKIAGDILDYDDFFVADDALAYDEKAFRKRLRKPNGMIDLLGGLAERLETLEGFGVAALEALIHRFTEDEEIKIGQIVHALRVALTGKAVGFGLFETMEILGKDRCLARIERAVRQIEG
ncbi:MAG: glutamate--tRNA ligase [Gemmatimonadetes bacterium]|nr:glutamate--tRNA ligase [Gemmatimonadota bacterium]